MDCFRIKATQPDLGVSVGTAEVLWVWSKGQTNYHFLFSSLSQQMCVCACVLVLQPELVQWEQWQLETFQ